MNQPFIYPISCMLNNNADFNQMIEQMSSIKEEIKELYLYKIQVFEDKTSEYRQKHKSIKENNLSRVSGNSSSMIMRIILGILCLGFIILSLMTLIPHELILIIREYPLNINKLSYEDLFKAIEISKYVFLFLSFIFYRMGRLIKKNLQKKKIICKLSKLTDELIVFMDTEADHEKTRYEHLKDHSSDLDYRIKQQA